MAPAPTPSAAGSAPDPQRGLALLFTLAGLFGVVVTLVAWTSRSYRRLSAAEADAEAAMAAAVAS